VTQCSSNNDCASLMYGYHYRSVCRRVSGDIDVYLLYRYAGSAASTYASTDCSTDSSTGHQLCHDWKCRYRPRAPVRFPIHVFWCYV
jgi:hypothetical protein